MSVTERLVEFIRTSPTAHHAARSAVSMLTDSGFAEMDPTHSWTEMPPRGVVARDGAVVAWAGAPGATAAPCRLIGAHTDSPNLRIRPRPDTGRAGFRQLGIEVYGGALVNSWLDRDLTLAGRVAVADDDSASGITHHLFHHDTALLRVPQLAIHLDRGVNDGLVLDRQRHLTPIWGLGVSSEGDFRAWLAEVVGVQPHDVIGWDVSCADTADPAVLGADAEFLAAPRLDNLFSCFAALEAVSGADGRTPSVVVLFDHEEVGSTSATGAGGTWAAQVLERLATASGGGRTTLLESLASSFMLSADMAHGTHPNYPERHEPSHPIALGRGPVIKHNANVRYATDSRGTAAFRLACRSVGVDPQEYSHRGDLACGSTIGPLTAAGLAVDTVDVGAPQLSMHSVRELMAVADIGPTVDAFTAWL